MTPTPLLINGKRGSRVTHISPAPAHHLRRPADSADLFTERRLRPACRRAPSHRGATTLAFTSTAAYDGSRLLLQRPSCNASRMTLGRGLCGLRRLGVA